MESLREKHFYHIYNRGINSEALFLRYQDYKTFMKWYYYYTFPVLDTYSYALMKNHFHILVRIKTIAEQIAQFQSFQKITKIPEFTPHGYEYRSFKKQSPSRQLSHFFSRYTLNFNKWNNRTGKLFEQPFKRIQINNEDYLVHLICYIHRNPIHHGIVSGFNDYPHTSYKLIVSEKNTLINRNEVLNWFGGLEGFKKAHQEMKIKLQSEYILE